MTNKIFIYRQNTIKHFFNHSEKYFLKILKTNPDLQQYKNILKFKMSKKILRFCNTIIYSLIDKTKNKLSKYFNLDYVNVLKSISIITLFVEKNERNNIFDYDFEIKKNEIDIKNIIEINDLYFSKILENKDVIYSLAFYLNKLLKTNITIYDWCYLIIYLLLLILINSDMYKYKKILGFHKIKIKDFSEEKTKEYLLVFKNIRIKMQDLFPSQFNDLIFVINS